MQEYIVNNRDERNPNGNHEVHTKKHALERHIELYTSLGVAIAITSMIISLCQILKGFPTAKVYAFCLSTIHENRKPMIFSI